MSDSNWYARYTYGNRTNRGIKLSHWNAGSSHLPSRGIVTGSKQGAGEGGVPADSRVHGHPHSIQTITGLGHFTARQQR